MSFFGKKKEEAKKEFEDIHKIKEMIEPSDIPSVSKEEPVKSVTEQWLQEVGGNVENTETESSQSKPEGYGGLTMQELSFPGQLQLPGQIPKAELLQTQNVAPMARTTAGTSTRFPATLQKSQDQIQMSEIPESAPLFIKLDRYRNILHTISDLKSTVTKVKNAFEMFSEMERVKAENLRVIEAAVQKVESRLADLDSEFLRPSGLKEKEATGHTEHMEQQHEFEVAPAVAEEPNDEGLHGMISDLRSQIDKLKEELDQMSENEVQ